MKAITKAIINIYQEISNNFVDVTSFRCDKQQAEQLGFKFDKSEHVTKAEHRRLAAINKELKPYELLAIVHVDTEGKFLMCMHYSLPDLVTISETMLLSLLESNGDVQQLQNNQEIQQAIQQKNLMLERGYRLN